MSKWENVLSTLTAAMVPATSGFDKEFEE